MKKCWILLLALLLSGCVSQEVFERVEDHYQVLSPQPGLVTLDVPVDAAVNTMEMDQGNTIYFCDGYTLTVQTLAGGNLEKTIQDLTGFPPASITMLQTMDGTVKRYVGTWTCAGEAGDHVGRLVLLDDGAYHYAVTVMAPAEIAGDLRLAWDTVLDSVSLAGTGT